MRRLRKKEAEERGVPRWMSEHDAHLLDKPSVDQEPYCAVCGRPATNRHHVIEKGMGGVSRELERRIPKVTLCGMGNASGCHGKVHAHLLHLYWDDDGYGGGRWVMYETPEPMDDWRCWEAHMGEYVTLPGWEVQQRYGRPIGGRR